MKNWAIALAASLALSGCDVGSKAETESYRDRADALVKQIESLTAENARLTQQNAQLRETAAVLHGEVAEQIRKRDISGAEVALSKLAAKFPNSAEARDASTSLSKLKREEEERSAEAARIAALGFKALKISPTISNGDSTLSVKSASMSSSFTFDAYGNEWRYKEAEKGERFITAKVTVSSESKDPRLMGLAAYVADGNQLRRIGTFEYRFSRWDDYASYLGNDADYRNDFAHSSAIPFSIAATVRVDEIKKPTYLVSTKEGCFTRATDRFRSPPVWYTSSSYRSLATTLSVDSFSDGKLVVVRRLD